MFGRMKYSLCALLVLVLSAGKLFAQTDGTYGGFSPYSVFGLGQLHQGGTSWNRGMGGVGIAARNHRFVNILNPASITARDSLSFMADMGISGRMSLFKENGKQAFNTTFNIDDVAISFPMWRNTAFMLGLKSRLEEEYARWERTNRLPSGLYWQGDVQDGMEESISGGRKKHYARPTINSYMFGNAKALAVMNRMTGETAKATVYEQKADTLRQLVETKLWNKNHQFFNPKKCC